MDEQPVVPVEDQLKELSGAIADFESTKPTQRKSDLEVFVKKKEAAVKAYTDEVFQKKRKIWIEQNERIIVAHDALIKIPGWKDLIKNCVCPARKQLKEMEGYLDGLLAEAKGQPELDRDAAKAAYLAAKQTVDELLNNSAKIDALLTRNGKAVEDIIQSLKHPESAAALFPLFFEVLPDHKQLTALRDKDCIAFSGDDETPEKLCPPPPPEPPPAEKAAGEEQAAAEKKAAEKKATEKKVAELPSLHAVPWLIGPGAPYKDALDLAWAYYAEAKKAFDNAEEAYKAFQADIADTRKTYDTASKALPGLVKECLEDHAPAPVCK